METISALLPFVAISPVTGEFPSQGQWHVALMFSFICAWTNGCANNRDAGDLRRHRAHYDVTVMLYSYTTMISAVGCQNIGKWFIAIVDHNFGNSITDKCNDIYQMSGISYIYRIRESTSVLDKIFVIWYINSMHIRYWQDTDNHRYSWYLFWINIILETKISCLDFAKTVGCFPMSQIGVSNMIANKSQ